MGPGVGGMDPLCRNKQEKKKVGDLFSRRLRPKVRRWNVLCFAAAKMKTCQCPSWGPKLSTGNWTRQSPSGFMEHFGQVMERPLSGARHRFCFCWFKVIDSFEYSRGTWSDPHLSFFSRWFMQIMEFQDFFFLRAGSREVTWLYQPVGSARVSGGISAVSHPVFSNYASVDCLTRGLSIGSSCDRIAFELCPLWRANERHLSVVFVPMRS